MKTDFNSVDCRLLKMSASELRSEISNRIRDLKCLQTKIMLMKADGKLEEYSAMLHKSQKLQEKFMDWFREVLSIRSSEVCSLIRRKEKPPGLPSFVSTEPSYPDVIMALRMFSRNELEVYLPSDCIQKLKNFRL